MLLLLREQLTEATEIFAFSILVRFSEFVYNTTEIWKLHTQPKIDQSDVGPPNVLTNHSKEKSTSLFESQRYQYQHRAPRPKLT